MLNYCKRSPCPIACILDLLGDKWTLLIIRDLFDGKKTYSEFQYSPEKIPTNILAGRLMRLIKYQIIIKSAYQKNPVRYEYTLSVEGEELGPILKEMIRWGEKHITNCKSFIKSQKE